MANPELVEDGEEVIIDLLMATAYKYIDSGTGVTAPVKADTGMETPCGEARDAGVQSEATASKYQVVATHTYAGSFTITECGLFTLVADGILIIRGTFTGIGVTSGDKIEFTITLEIL